jgi:glycosyltransferase involved in cell wall biosynthesis
MSGLSGRRDVPRGFGVNVIGHVSGNLGLGVIARNVVSVILSRGCPLLILDIDPGLGRGGHDDRFLEYTVGSIDELSYPVTLLVFPPDSVVHFLRDRRNQSVLSRRDGINAAVMNWEQMVVPHEWSRVLEGLDVIVAPSAFTRNTFEGALPSVPVISTKVPLFLPADAKQNRLRFGLQRDLIWFGSSFEPQSDPARKNPFAVLNAFEQACAGRQDAGLVIRVNNAMVDGRVHPVVEELRARSRRDGRVRLIEESLDYQGVLSLYGSLDVFVSLHRSEGIGLGLMEAMALGKPVVATAWSGNMSFMDRSNACLVAYNLVPVRGGTWVYSERVLGERAVWAEPDVDYAAAWMRVLVERPDVRAAIGRKAAEDMRRYQEEAQRGLFLDELRAIMDSEVLWGIGRKRRKVRRMRLEKCALEGGRLRRTWRHRAGLLLRKVVSWRGHN